MKVDGLPVFTIITHKGVVVERDISWLQPLSTVPVYKDLNYESLIGIAHLRIKRGAIVADIHLLANIKGFPAIAFKSYNGEVYALGICVKPNIDKRIKSL